MQTRVGAGQANFITGEIPIRTGMTTVGQAGTSIGMPAAASTIATALKELGYATGQFGRNHLGDSRTNSCPPSTDSTSSLAISIILMRWKIRFIGTTRNTVDPRRGKVGKQTIVDKGPLPPHPWRALS